VTVHLDHKAGDKMYVDYAGTKQSIVDPITGQAKEVEVFVAILGTSQLTYANLCLVTDIQMDVPLLPSYTIHRRISGYRFF